MPRLLTLIDRPLAKTSQLKLRNFFKKENNLARNTSEEKLIRELGYAFVSKTDAYRAMADEYNNYVARENVPIKLDRKAIRNTQARVRRATKTKAKVLVLREQALPLFELPIPDDYKYLINNPFHITIHTISYNIPVEYNWDALRQRLRFTTHGEWEAFTQICVKKTL